MTMTETQKRRLEDGRMMLAEWMAEAMMFQGWHRGFTEGEFEQASQGDPDIQNELECEFQGLIECWTG